MTPDQRSTNDQALDWLVKTGDPDFDDWDGFTAWLEQSPANADAYHAQAGGIADMDQWLDKVEPVVAPPLPLPTRNHRVRWAVAASFAALAATGAVLLSPAFTTDHYTTVAGQTQTIALGDGDELLLNGETEVKLGGLNRRDVDVEQGQVLLKMASGRHVEVTAGDVSFVDVGTVFEVAREGSRTRLLVKQGVVMADPSGAKVRVGAGQMLETSDGASQLKPLPSSDAEAGGWSTGQLTYSNATLTQVAIDLRRSTGLAFSPSGATGRRTFSGTLSVDNIRHDPASLAPLFGVQVRNSGGQWILEEGG